MMMMMVIMVMMMMAAKWENSDRYVFIQFSKWQSSL